MVVAVVTFRLLQPGTLSQMKAVFQSTATKYLNLPGLLRKNYFVSEDGLRAGGIYVWESKARAEQFYSPEWKSFVAGKYGAQPEIQYLDAPVMVDNSAGRITVD
jgi:hypothetical protein